ncbi:MAG: translation initiation factor IF-2 [Patescibacteria group bacterium]
MTTHVKETSVQIARHPIVVILGHVDHGKTTLLDTIRKTNVVASEAGGITQHLGAYEIIWNHRHITFLDTPGHETFSKMRERGARVADIAILVVAADDGVKPQTKEAYEAIKKAEIPYLIALNKIDKPSADPDRVKSALAEVGILVEGWGGTVPIVQVSAKAGTHIDELLDTVLLAAEMEELKADPNILAQGVVIEAHLDPRRGPSAMLLVTNGTLHKGEFVLAGSALSPVRILEDSLGKNVDEAGPSTPVTIVGFNKVPDVGVLFQAFHSKNELEKNLSANVAPIIKDVPDSTSAEVGIMLKADVAGSLEAISDEVRRVIPAGLPVRFFEGGVGDINENDIKTISSAHIAFVIGFHTKIKNQAADLAERFNVSVKTFDVIYEAIEWILAELKVHVPKQFTRDELGKLLVLKTFQSTGGGRIIGGRVREGKVVRDAKFDIMRAGERVGSGSVSSVQRNKSAVDALKEEEEGGLLVQSSRAIEERDILAFYNESRTN